MKFEEILPAIREGKRVRRNQRGFDWFAFGLHPQECRNFSMEDLCANDWEIVGQHEDYCKPKLPEKLDINEFRMDANYSWDLHIVLGKINQIIDCLKDRDNDLV